ncbi:MAG: nitrilase-related carbon-nitrogen hydrolase [Promethearchaeota archaeon]
MKVAAAQIHPQFAQPDKNRTIIQRYCRQAAQQDVDLIVFPELCITGYNFSSKKQVEAFAEPVPEGPTTQQWIELAKEYNMIIVGGLVEQGRSGDIYNSAAIVGPDQFFGCYQKIHLFANEKDWFLPGSQPPRIWKLPTATIGVLVCFDWAFPEVSRILMLEGCEILCLPSNLVLPYAQRVMVARSIENRMFTLLANRIGTEISADCSPITFTGRSQITNPLGDILARGSKTQSGLVIAEIHPQKAQDKFLTRQNHIIDDRRVELYQRLCNGDPR